MNIRNTKLGHDFLIPSSTESSHSAISLRPNSKDLSRSQPTSTIDDLLGGLAHLLGGNLKIPSSNNGSPIGSQSSSNQFNGLESNKIANFLSHISSNVNKNNNQAFRSPSPLIPNLIPRGPNGLPMMPNFSPNSNGLSHGPPKISSNGNYLLMPPSSSANLSPFQIPFIPLLSSSGTRPAAIPLNVGQNHMPMMSPPKSPKPNIISPPIPPSMHGLTKSDMDALLNQLINNNPNKTNAFNHLISKIVDRHDPLKDSLLPFNLNDTSKVFPPTIHASSTKEPQIITMEETPSVFEMVVQHQIGPSFSSTMDPILSTSSMIESSISSVTSASTIISTESLISALPDVTEIRNHHNQMIRVTNNAITKTTDVVYGKRIIPSTTQSPSSSTFSSTSILFQSSPSPSSSSSIFENSSLTTKTFQNGHIQSTANVINPTATLNSIAPSISSTSSSVLFGKPVVMQMPIENVKPKIRQFEPNKTLEGMNRLSGFEKSSIENHKSSESNQSSRTGSNSLTSTTSSSNKKSQARPYVRRPAFRPRPNVPIVRIDTCIVGDDSTCDPSLNEKCITELGLSSCQCRPGFARTIPRTNCTPVIALTLSFRVDKMSGNKIQFTRALLNSNSEEYQYLEYESIHAMNSLFSQTKSLQTDLMAVKINRFYTVGGRTIVNATVMLQNNETSALTNQKSSASINPTQNIKRVLQQELTQVIVDSNNNLGESQLAVDSPSNALARIDDLNECSSEDHNDCSKNARCINEFGGFRCECEPGYEDKFPDNKWQSGRVCLTCPRQYCSNRGECLIVKGERVCRCLANFIGSQCDIDAEVLGVAIGGSIAALVIIVITFICLYMWNQRFRQEQQKIEAMSAASGHTFSYLNKPLQTSTMSRLSMDERFGGRSWTHYSESQQHLLSSQSNINNGFYNSQSSNNTSTNTANHGTEHNHHHSNQNGSHVYAQPVRVIPTGNGNGVGSSSINNHHHLMPDYDPPSSGGSGASYGFHDSHSIWTAKSNRNSTQKKKSHRNGHEPFNVNQSQQHHHHRSGTISGMHEIHYPYKYDHYNETEFSTRELIYSPAHLYATNPRQSSHAFY
ncbi:AF-10 protein [Sarcoptes scabiei]|nr:AF-10 protein [Sarcoptes scabiei]